MPTGQRGRTHGIVGTYIWGCRCDACRLATSRYYYHRTQEERIAEEMPDHGTESRYNGRGCRCDDCMDAAAAARQRRRRENGPSATAVHGKASTYKNGCRCDACREANTADSRAWRKRQTSS